MLTISNQQKQIDELNTFKSLSKKVSSTSFENLGKTSGKIKLLEEKIDDMEQRSRNQCLWIHVISEQADENTDQAARSRLGDEWNPKFSPPWSKRKIYSW